MSKQLIEFLTELNTNEKLRKNFKSDKEQTMKKYGVPQSDAQLVLDKNYDEIMKKLGCDYDISRNSVIEAFKIKK
ncbi:MAG: hypothetical protein OQK04_12910 [Kangiellaceae bacterium]|nr:hypothetical protein [Kangiellaceae bacterium]MCW8999600.1 hypothetical protein [Kangiellaceae bacterium]